MKICKLDGNSGKNMTKWCKIGGNMTAENEKVYTQIVHDFRVRETSLEVREMYDKRILQLKLERGRHGKVSLEESRIVLEQVLKRTPQIAMRQYSVDSLAMRLTWERAGGDKNPPLKGANDD